MISRRGFVGAGASLFAAAGLNAVAAGKEEKKEVIQGFDETDSGAKKDAVWTPYSDRKVRVGIAGEGFCNFGSAFGYQACPNAEVVACAELDAARRARLQERVKAQKAYSSCEDQARRRGQARGRLHRHRRAEPHPARDHGARARAPCRERRAGLPRQGPA